LIFGGPRELNARIAALALRQLPGHLDNQIGVANRFPAALFHRLPDTGQRMFGQ